MYAPYFFLSYAHSDPLAGNPREDPDQLVGTFFSDLTDAVKRHSSQPPEFEPGFYDQAIPKGSNWKQFLSSILGAAQVIVPLYSPGYLARSRPGRELACFRRRAELAGQTNPAGRFVPVLWTPLPGTQDPPGLKEALELDGGEPGYAENGLRALLKIKSYRASYQAVVDLLARRIVTLAEGAPIGPSEVPDIDQVKSEFLPRRRLAIFAIQTIARSAATSPPGLGGRGYGTDSTQWRPFPDQELPLGEYAKEVAERFDFEAQVSGIEKGREGRQRRPGIILIDPWFIADDPGRAALTSAVGKLPRWVLPLVILGMDDERTNELAAQVRDMLVGANAVPTDFARRAANGVRSLDEFVAIVPLLVAEAERQYLRYRSGRVASDTVATMRPVLRYLSDPDEPAATPDSSGDASDA
jgi:FxsC-like protein